MRAVPHRSRSLHAARSFTEDVTRILDAVPALKAYAAGAAAEIDSIEC